MYELPHELHHMIVQIADLQIFKAIYPYRFEEPCTLFLFNGANTFCLKWFLAFCIFLLISSHVSPMFKKLNLDVFYYRSSIEKGKKFRKKLKLTPPHWRCCANWWTCYLTLLYCAFVIRYAQLEPQFARQCELMNLEVVSFSIRKLV